MTAQLSLPSPYQVILWRCSGCGKWSHAVRRPKHHARFLRGATKATTLALGFTVLTEHETRDEDDLGGVSVVCGPFERWIAIPSAEANAIAAAAMHRLIDAIPDAQSTVHSGDYPAWVS